MCTKIEACSVVDGAWYEVIPESCSLVYHKRTPCVRMKYADFDFTECELYQLEHFYQNRFRIPFKLAQTDTELLVGQDIVGFAISENERKWYDATVEKITKTDDDVQVTVDWRLGYYFMLFGIPSRTVLSVDKGEVGIPGEAFDPDQHPVLVEWIKALREVSNNKEQFQNCDIRLPFDAGQTKKALFLSNEDYAPLSLMQNSGAKKQKHNDDDTMQPKI
eukprot:g7659.t1